MAVWTMLLDSAIHSPSPHNVQPWRVKIISDTEAELFMDSARTLPKEDLTGSFIILTMGIFIEALRLLAAKHGFKLEHQTHHEPDWYAAEIPKLHTQTFLPFARLTLLPDAAKSDFDPALFLKRRTSRLSLHPQTVPEDVTTSLKALAAKWDHRYECITDPSTIEKILQKNTEAVFTDLNNREYHDEIVEWFRFSDKSAKLHRDGLDYRCMNTSRSAYWLSAKVPQLLQLPVTREILAKIYRAQLGTVPTVGMLAGDFWPPQSAFKAGSFLMNFWFETAKHDLYLHPYGNLVTNKEASSWLVEETGIERIWFIFKIGYSLEPPKSYRRSVKEILLD